MKLLFFCALIFLGSVATPQEKPYSFWKKVNKNLELIFNVKDIVRENIKYPDERWNQNNSELRSDGTFRLKNKGETLGFLVLASSKGRMDYFDYMIVYQPDISIKKLNILNYLSTHGGEVASQKWLKQFEGYNGGLLKYGKDIDAISGATISAGSLVRDVEFITNFLKKNNTK